MHCAVSPELGHFIRLGLDYYYWAMDWDLIITTRLWIGIGLLLLGYGLGLDYYYLAMWL